jgi:ferritin-like protein
VSTTYHESMSELSDQAKEVHRALASTIEELEAIDWYNQRADVSKDDSLKAVLLHNRNEEIEHAAMGLEWLRRVIPELDEALRTYLFTSAPITEIEESATGSPAGHAAARSDLRIGSLKKEA